MKFMDSRTLEIEKKISDKISSLQTLSDILCFWTRLPYLNQEIKICIF